MNKRIYIIYLLLLIIFSIYVLLDTFVIPKEIETINDNTNDTVEEDNNNKTNTNSIKITDDSYTDNNISITIATLREYDTDIYIADIILSDINYLKTAFANSTYGKNIKATASTIAEKNNAILAINGDYYGFRNLGFVLRNGTIYRSSSNGFEGLVIYNDGSFDIYDENNTDLDDLYNNGAYQAFSFGPALIDNKIISVSVNDEVGQAMTSNPRTAIGIINDLHYVFVVSDGRTSESSGLTLYELANVMNDLKCTYAYNLDGGGSTTMYFNGKVINNPTSGNKSGERKVSDIIYVGY